MQRDSYIHIGESMPLSSFVVGLVLAFALGTGVAECAQVGSDRVARVGYVATVAKSSISIGYTVDFWQRLHELGWTKGKNILVEERWADGDVGRVPGLIAEVIARKVDVIVTGTDSGALAARKTTSTIPIVAVALGDPVSTGVVDSLARPGGNLTGLSLQTGEGVPGKCLELSRETLPGLSTIAVLWNPKFPTAQVQVRQLEKDAATHGIKLQLIAFDSWQSLQAAFAQARARAKAAIFFSDPLAYSDRRRVTALAAQSRLPVIYTVLDFVNDGGLMGYGGDFRVMYRRAAEYVDKVLRGAKPGDLPIEQANELQLALNLKAARALGLTIPESILLRAEDVSR
jgi:putative ABC transport system substrate-binding protein